LARRQWRAFLRVSVSIKDEQGHDQEGRHHHHQAEMAMHATRASLGWPAMMKRMVGSIFGGGTGLHGGIAGSI